MVVNDKLVLFFIGIFLFAAGGELRGQQQQAADVQIPYQFQAHFNSQYEQSAQQFAFKGNTRGDFNQWQKAFLPRLKQSLGLNLIESQLSGYKIRAEKKEEQDKGDYMLERWILWTEPTVPLPFILLKPKNKTGKLPLVIAPHGHGKNTEAYAGIYTSEADRKHNEEGERDIAVQAVKQGYLAIAPTVRAFGATRSVDDIKKDKISSCRTQLLRDLLVGRTPIGERVWDIAKLIDWALTAQQVQEKNIIVTGNSGGGTVTLFAAACDPRISIAIPGSYFCTFEKSIGSIEHCDCNYVPGILTLGEMADVAGLIAPRSFCAVNGVSDPIFPVEATRQSFAHLQQIYKAAGVAEQCELFIGEGGHRYYAAGAWPFVKKHLK